MDFFPYLYGSHQLYWIAFATPDREVLTVYLFYLRKLSHIEFCNNFSQNISKSKFGELRHDHLLETKAEVMNIFLVSTKIFANQFFF